MGKKKNEPRTIEDDIAIAKWMRENRDVPKDEEDQGMYDFIKNVTDPSRDLDLDEVAALRPNNGPKRGKGWKMEDTSYAWHLRCETRNLRWEPISKVLRRSALACRLHYFNVRTRMTEICSKPIVPKYDKLNISEVPDGDGEVSDGDGDGEVSDGDGDGEVSDGDSSASSSPRPSKRRRTSEGDTPGESSSGRPSKRRRVSNVDPPGESRSREQEPVPSSSQNGTGWAAVNRPRSPESRPDEEGPSEQPQTYDDQDRQAAELLFQMRWRDAEGYPLRRESGVASDDSPQGDESEEDGSEQGDESQEDGPSQGSSRGARPSHLYRASIDYLINDD